MWRVLGASPAASRPEASVAERRYSAPALKGGAMQKSEPRYVNLIQLYRPLCSKCGALTELTRIEPSDLPNHDLRTFVCVTCGNTDMVTMKLCEAAP